MDPNNPSYLSASPGEGASTARSWIIVLALAFCFLLWGLLIFFTVGVSWPPPWRYGIVPDVPGQSIYSVSPAEKQAGSGPLKGDRIREQHVRDGRTGYQPPPDKGGY